MTRLPIITAVLFLSAPLTGITADTPTDRPIYEAPQGAMETMLKPRGSATLRVLFWDIYESTLFTPDGDWSPDIRPLRLDIRYLRNIESANLVEQTRKEWQSQGITSEQHDRWLAVLETIWPNVTPGDVISLSIDLEGRSTFSFNGNRVGSIEAAGFGADFAGIWLSPSTSRPKLRAALIGLEN